MYKKSAVFLEYRRLLFTLAYNMLADVAAASMLLEEVYLEWLMSETGPVRQIKVYFVREIIKRCIDGRPKPESFYPGASIQSAPYFSLSMGVMALLDKLEPLDRALFILREVLVYDYQEISEVLDRPSPVCREWYQQVIERLGGEAGLSEANVRGHEKILHQFMRALLEKDEVALSGCLCEDVELVTDGGRGRLAVSGQGLTMIPEPIRGRIAACRFILNTLEQVVAGLPFFRWEMAIANGMPAIISYVGQEPVCLNSFETDGERIRNIYVQVRPDTLRRIRGGS